MTLNPGELLLYESARLPHGRTSFLRFASFHLLQLDYQVNPLIWPAVSVSICGLGLLVTLFLCHLFVEPKEKTGLKPYYDRYLFLSEGRASPIYLCIFVQLQVGFHCICNWKYCKRYSLFFKGWVQEDWRPVHASLISSWCKLHQMCERKFCFVKRVWAVMFTQSCI